MIHEFIFIVFIFLSIGAGVWAVVLTNNLNNTYKLNYLTTYLYYEILLFIFGLFGLIGTALIKWILQEMETPMVTVETIANLIPYLGIPFVIVAWYLFIKMSLEMIGKSVSSVLTISYFLVMLIIILGYGYLIVYLFRSQSENAQIFSDYAKFVFIGIEAITLLIAFFILYVVGRRIKHKGQRKSIVVFANINLLVSAMVITLFFFLEKDPIIAGSYILLFFAGDIPAILYLGNYLDKNYLTTSGTSEAISPYTDFITNYQISKREWEIIEKISDGMTNKQVSEALFISLQTVKDHTHRIYKKTGVKNRVQLVNMVSNTQKKNE